MLVLSRRPQERIVFPKLGIEVEILGVSGSTVRVGVNAPREVLVLRHEVAEKDAARASQSAATTPAETRPEPVALARTGDNASPAATTPTATTPTATTPTATTPAATSPPAPAEAISATRKWMHQLRNHLNTASLAVQLVQSQMACGDLDDADADAKLQLAIAKLNDLATALESGPSSVAPPATTALPAAVRAAERFSPPSEPRPADISAAANQPASLSRKPLALVVEDNADDSEFLAGVLRRNGFSVDTASDGCHALDYLATHKRPDVVLLDMRMPRCDGPTTISKIRSNPQFSGLRVVAVSGYRSSELGVGTGPQGVDRWFCKPVDPTRLVHELKHDLHVTTGAARPEQGKPR